MIFRLGRIRDDEAKGPGIFFLMPCIDKFIPVDVRTKSFDVPPQRVRRVEGIVYSVSGLEVSTGSTFYKFPFFPPDPH